MLLILKSAAARLTAISAVAGLAMLGAVAAAPPAGASGGVDVFVGYADSLRAGAANFPTPWDGSPGVTFEGCTGSCTFDAGAVRVVNNSASPVHIDSVTVKVSTCSYNMWPAANIAPGDQLIVTQTISGASDGCVSDHTMDTSDVGPGGIGYAGNCSPDGVVPEVDVSINGSVSTFTDSGQVLNTKGVDAAVCPPGTSNNESTQWTPVGNAPCAGSSLTLAPPSQHQDVGGSAKVTATFTNSCGDPLQGTSVDFSVTSGPNAGKTGTGVTDASGQATFSYPGRTAGTDTVHASVTNLAGTIPSNDVQVIWDKAITAAGGRSFTGTEPAAVSGTVATFTDPDPTAPASEYSATIDWGDGGPASAGTITGSRGSFTVTGGHSYADEGTYKITVTITDTDNAANKATATDAAVIGDAALTASGISPLPVSGQSFGGPVATFTDANATTSSPADFTATINWGDGSPSSAGTVTGSGGSYRVAGSHTYAGTGFFTVKVHIVDDGGSTADAQTKVLIFGLAKGGSFVIGDGNAAAGKAVTFWGAQWQKLNTLSGGAAPAAFKGFEDQPARVTCGKGWTTDPGNSTPPPAGPLPAFMAVIVSSSVSQSGSAISGDTPSMVVVQTNSGYAPDPGHAGTGTVIAKIC